MGSILSAQQVTAWRVKLAALLLPDSVAVQTVTNTRTANGITPAYATDSGRGAVACRIDPAKTVERIANGITVTATEYPIWFAFGTEPTRIKSLLAADGLRYNIITIAPETEWTELVEVRAARIGGAT